MPWSETTPMAERVRFIVDLERNLYTMSELCSQYGISRKTGYKWAARYAEGGYAGLEDRSRAPRRCPHRTPQAIVDAVLAVRRQHPRWGPKKLVAVLRRRHPEQAWPAASTVGGILTRAGLVKPRRYRRRVAPSPKAAPDASLAPNDLWSVDFKGHFRTGNGRYCYPLTVVDRSSRFILGCQAQRSIALDGTRASFAALFREYGLPRGILSDNGTPFSSAALGGLSRLSVWWIKLGIQPLRIEPGHPEQNGGHERMHRTLKGATTRPPASNLRGQQVRFDSFRREYNEERPHEALGQRPPTVRYEPSVRRYPGRLGEVEYPGHYEVRRVRTSGQIKWRGAFLYLSQALTGELVGLEEVDDGVWSVDFGPVHLARFDQRKPELIADTSVAPHTTYGRRGKSPTTHRP